MSGSLATERVSPVWQLVVKLLVAPGTAPPPYEPEQLEAWLVTVAVVVETMVSVVADAVVVVTVFVGPLTATNRLADIRTPATMMAVVSMSELRAFWSLN